jgi:hypothetical protein
MANKKITITISDDAFHRLELQSSALDITPNTYIKQVVFNYLNKHKVEFITSEQRLVVQEFQGVQAQLLNALNKISRQYLDKGIHFPQEDVLKFFKSYHEQFKYCIQRLTHDNEKHEQ